MFRKLLAISSSALALCVAVPAHAVGSLVDVQVVDRDTGETLTPILHRGEWWIAGRPGARYGVALLSRDGRRTLNVVSVDGVNAISGDSAAWSQTGYVLGPYQRTEIDGWRKNINQVAAFEFTALPDSYAARTGRPANVGVIGVAVFYERPKQRPLARPDVDRTEPSRSRAEPVPAPAPASPAADAAKAEQAPAESESNRRSLQAERLGTGHGAIEESSIRYVAFQRAQSTPNEIVTIHYDRLENLVAMGIVPPKPVALPPVAVNPFPNSSRFVADPPPR